MLRVARLLAAIAFCSMPLSAAHTDVALVPWQVLDIGATADAPLALYWVPASPEELRRSPLLTSRELALFASRCVAMRVVRSNDHVRLRALGVEAGVPSAVLADRGGNVVGRVEAARGALSLHAVADLVREEVERRESEAEARLDTARRRLAARDRDAAAALYRMVWDDRCLCPRQAREAKRALRKLERR